MDDVWRMYGGCMEDVEREWIHSLYILYTSSTMLRHVVC